MLLPLTLALALAGMGIDPGQPKTYVQLTNAPIVSMERGKAATVELKFRVSEGFHINSNAPRSSYLIPTKLELKVPPELGTVKVSYPKGKDFVFAFAPDEKLNVYSGEFTLVGDLKLADAAKEGHHKVAGDLTYQACNDRACFPPKKLPVSIDVMVHRRVRIQRKEPPPIDPTRG